MTEAAPAALPEHTLYNVTRDSPYHSTLHVFTGFAMHIFHVLIMPSVKVDGIVSA